jgi:hypothetical protein
MKSVIQDKIAGLATRAGELYPTARIDLANLPSGAAWLNVHRTEDTHQLYYSTDLSTFFVDELRDDDAFQLNFRFAYPDFQSAAEQLLKMLNEAEGGRQVGAGTNAQVLNGSTQ